jgi:hypothetical protein
VAPILPVAKAVERVDAGVAGLGSRIVFVVDVTDGRPATPIPGPLRQRYRPVAT